jgi:hypothetical protein
MGVNYNQVVKHLKATFTDKAVRTLPYKLEKTTKELAAINQQIMVLTKEFEKTSYKLM